MAPSEDGENAVNGTQYAIVAYAAGLGLLWGYGLVLLVGWRRASRKRG